MPVAAPRQALTLALVLSPKLPLRRRLAFAMLVAVVGLGHRWLLAGLGAWATRPATVAASAPQPLSVWLVPSPTPQPDAPPSGARAEGRAPASPVAKPARQRLPQVAAPAKALAEPVTPMAATEPAQAPSAPTPTLSEDGGAVAPPTYPTRLPPPVRLRFAVQRGEQLGEAEWRWQHDGRHFVSHLQSALPGRTALDHQTRGEFDSAGLAPVRMLESQRGRAVRAVNFQRDKGVVSFSGSARQWALWPGAQDRASWLPQLLAVVAGRGAWAPGQQIELAVAGPRGDLDRWAFTLEDDAGPDGEPRGSATHWVRQPLRPYDSRVDVWLGPVAPHWPLALQWQVLPGGEPLRWRLQGAAEAP